MIRRQLPAHSPLPFRALRRGARTLLGRPEDPRVKLLNGLRERQEAGAGILTDSGTSALRMALEACRAAGREPVALPAFSCYDVATAAVGSGASVLFYDVEPRTLAPDRASLDGVLARGAGAIVVAPLYGFPVDWDGIHRAAAPSGAVVVEDAAQSHGSRWRGKPAGSFGHLTVLSFGRGKGWTGGAGGALLAREPERAADMVDRPPLPEPRSLEELIHLLKLLAQWALGRPGIYGAPHALPGLGLGETRYRAPRSPRAMHRVPAAVALETEEPARAEVALRRSNAQHYRELLEEASQEPGADAGGALPTPAEPVTGGECGYLRFPVLLPEGSTHRSLSHASLRLGATASHPRVLPALAPLAGRTPEEDPTWSALPGAHLLASRLVTLPTHGLTTTSERSRLVAGFRVAGEGAGNVTTGRST